MPPERHDPLAAGACGIPRLRIYTSKIDGLYYFLMLVVPLTFVAILVLLNGAAFPGMPAAAATAVRILFFAVLAFPLWTLVGTWYALDSNALYVRSGPFRWTISLREIHSVTAARDYMRSSPALSLDRLRIEYGSGRSIMISPRDKEAFMRDLEHQLALTRGHPSAAG